MIALEMMMRDILAQRTTQHPLPDWNHLREAFVTHASDPSFRVGIQIERARWQPDDSNSLPHEQLPKCSAVLRVAIEEQPASGPSTTSSRFRPTCIIQSALGWTVIPAIRIRRVARSMTNKT